MIRKLSLFGALILAIACGPGEWCVVVTDGGMREGTCR